jgi:hypothetical protein
MATYKLIQDIEAEDKILGPLTLKQFIFALITAFFGYISFLCVSNHVPFLLVLFLPPTLAAGFFAVPFGKDQPTEIWALAKIRFYFKPRKRIWDQSGVKELVTITVPKKVERILTNGLSQNEVQSRLKTLASTIDSRGWATKNVNVNLYAHPSANNTATSDRLVNMSSLPQEVPDYAVQASDDMLDETNNAVAHQFDNMITASAKTRRQQLIDELNKMGPDEAPATQTVRVDQSAVAPNDYWFLHQPALSSLPPTQSIFTNTQVVQPGTGDPGVPARAETADEAALAAQFKARNAAPTISYAHLRTIQPLGSTPTQPPAVRAQAPIATSKAPVTAATTITQPVAAPQQQPQEPSAPRYDPAILSLANNNDLNVATLAREAYKAINHEDPPEDEVVITLH